MAEYTTTTRTAYKDAVTAWAAGLDPVPTELTFADVRAGVPELADAPQGHVHQAILDAGFAAPEGVA